MRIYYYYDYDYDYDYDFAAAPRVAPVKVASRKWVVSTHLGGLTPTRAHSQLPCSQ